jgi:hypothetical protein
MLFFYKNIYYYDMFHYYEDCFYNYMVLYLKAFAGCDFAFAGCGCRLAFGGSGDCRLDWVNTITHDKKDMSKY